MNAKTAASLSIPFTREDIDERIEYTAKNNKGVRFVILFGITVEPTLIASLVSDGFRVSMIKAFNGCEDVKIDW